MMMMVVVVVVVVVVMIMMMMIFQVFKSTGFFHSGQELYCNQIRKDSR